MNYCCKSQTIRALYATLIHTADPNSFRRLGRRPCMRPQETHAQKKSCAGKPKRENGGTRLRGNATQRLPPTRGPSATPASQPTRCRRHRRPRPRRSPPRSTRNVQRSTFKPRDPGSPCKNNSILRRACARVSAPRPRPRNVNLLRPPPPRNLYSTSPPHFCHHPHKHSPSLPLSRSLPNSQLKDSLQPVQQLAWRRTNSFIIRDERFYERQSINGSADVSRDEGRV